MRNTTKILSAFAVSIRIEPGSPHCCPHVVLRQVHAFYTCSSFPLSFPRRGVAPFWQFPWFPSSSPPFSQILSISLKNIIYFIGVILCKKVVIGIKMYPICHIHTNKCNISSFCNVSGWVCNINPTIRNRPESAYPGRFHVYHCVSLCILMCHCARCMSQVSLYVIALAVYHCAHCVSLRSLCIVVLSVYHCAHSVSLRSLCISCAHYVLLVCVTVNHC